MRDRDHDGKTMDIIVRSGKRGLIYEGGRDIRAYGSHPAVVKAVTETIAATQVKRCDNAGWIENPATQIDADVCRRHRQIDGRADRVRRFGQCVSSGEARAYGAA